MNQNKAFTLVELLLSIAITALLFLSIQQTMAYGTHVTKVVRKPFHTDALVLLQQMNQSLRNAYMSQEKEVKTSFQGASNSLKFNCIVPTQQWREGEPDRQECSFRLEGGARDNVRALYRRSLGGDQILQERILSIHLNQLTFRFFDGASWKEQWQSDTLLPQAVEVTVRFKQESKAHPFLEYKTTVLIPCARI